MEEYEPITKELREKAMLLGVATVDGETPMLHYVIERDVFDHLCDNIDAVHKRLEALCNRTKDEWIRLPVDADGMPIHVGDVLDGYAKTITVEYMEYGVDGWAIVDDGAVFYDSAAFAHHHTPTVEDVLQEFAEKMNANMDMYTSEVIDVDEWHDYDEQVIAEYAAKLREVMSNDRD